MLQIISKAYVNSLKIKFDSLKKSKRVSENFKNGKFLPKKQVFRIKSRVKSKLFELEGLRNLKMHFMIYEFTDKFLSEFGG